MKLLDAFIAALSRLLDSGQLRKLARGKPCMVRLPGVCNGNPETTVLAHYRLAGTCGGGMKPDDTQGAWACSSCHDECDRRTRKLETEFVRLAHAEGVLRTQYEIRKMKETHGLQCAAGVLKYKGENE